MYYCGFPQKLKESKNSPQTVPDTLHKETDRIIAGHTINVTQGPLTAASGNKHDYISIGPYWWSNPETADGLPYI